VILLWYALNVKSSIDILRITLMGVLMYIPMEIMDINLLYL